jgi:hypothetical protein
MLGIGTSRLRVRGNFRSVSLGVGFQKSMLWVREWDQTYTMQRMLSHPHSLCATLNAASESFLGSGEIPVYADLVDSTGFSPEGVREPMTGMRGPAGQDYAGERGC